MPAYEPDRAKRAGQEPPGPAVRPQKLARGGINRGTEPYACHYLVKKYTAVGHCLGPQSPGELEPQGQESTHQLTIPLSEPRLSLPSRSPKGIYFRVAFI